MPDIEIRWSVTDVGCEPEPACDGIGKRVAGDGRGTVIHGFAIGVGTSELEAVAHPFLDIRLKTFVRGAASEGQVPDTPEVRINPQISARRIKRPEISGRSLRRQNHIPVVTA